MTDGSAIRERVIDDGRMNVGRFASPGIALQLTCLSHPDHSLDRRMLFEALFTHAKQIPNELAAADDSGRYTFAQLAAMSAGMGLFLSMQTSKPRVGIL